MKQILTNPQKRDTTYSVIMRISLRLNNEDYELIKAYADMNGLTVSELLRRSVLERIEDEFDLKAYDEAMNK